MKNSLILRMLIRYDTLAFLLCIVIFVTWPQFDLYVSHLFYDEINEIFFYKNSIIAKSIYELTNLTTMVIIILLPITIGASWLLKNDFLIQRRITFVFLLTALIVGPGLLVNMTLKENWGRPRPKDTLEFGGDISYQPPFSPSFECRKCRSFVSGHASVGFYFFSLALLSRKRKWLLLPVTAGIIIGTTRIAQGAHFFSDVLFSAWVVWFSSLFLYTLFFGLRIFDKKAEL